jgi:hypothetical protein
VPGGLVVPLPQQFDALETGSATASAIAACSSTR